MRRFARWFRFNWLYFGHPRWDTGVSPPELLEFIGSHPPGRAIDLGCGTGTNLVTLGQAGWQVTGVDFALKAVLAARRRMASAGVLGQVRAGDVSRLETVRPDDKPYDLALDIGCYHGLEPGSRAAYRHSLFEILAPGGFFLIYAHWARQDVPGSIGITQTDLNGFQEWMVLEDRRDSQDRWGRSATRMCFRRPQE